MPYMQQAFRKSIIYRKRMCNGNKTMDTSILTVLLAWHGDYVPVSYVSI